jgi:hypothetical protein
MAAIAACVGAACLAGPSPARAGFPFTAESWVDPCIVVCPAGDSAFTVFARRNGQWSGDPVWIDFCNCPGVVFAPTDGSEPYFLSGCTVYRSSPEPGTTLFEFPLKAGGVCSGVAITISLFIPDNFVRTAVASFDQNGDLVVDGADIAIAQGKLGTSDPTADFDCDGAVTNADLGIQQGHLGHEGHGVTAVDAPLAPELALKIPANPTRSEIRVAFSLPNASPARLECFDLAGRMIAAREVGTLGPGSHFVTLASGRRLPPGAYVLRLSQGSRSRTARAVVLR